MLKTSFGDQAVLKKGDKPLETLKKVLKQRTKGMFFESLHALPDPGERLMNERSSLLEVNPEL
jgi:hypothetical protein